VTETTNGWDNPHIRNDMYEDGTPHIWLSFGDGYSCGGAWNFTISGIVDPVIAKVLANAGRMQQFLRTLVKHPDASIAKDAELLLLKIITTEVEVDASNMLSHKVVEDDIPTPPIVVTSTPCFQPDNS
jgi:hypothetical protein